MSKRVLIVDDDPMIRDVLVTMLGAEGFQTVTAENGKHAVTILDSEPRPLDYSMIVLDVMMPEVEADVIRNYTAALLALFSVCNAASWILVNNAQSSASETITQLIDEPSEEGLESSELLDGVKEEDK